MILREFLAFWGGEDTAFYLRREPEWRISPLRDILHIFNVGYSALSLFEEPHCSESNGILPYCLLAISYLTFPTCHLGNQQTVLNVQHS